MIRLNNKVFANSDKEYDEITERGEKVVGWYCVYKNHIALLDSNKNKIGVICNRVLGSASKLDNGKWWYSYAIPELIGNYDESKEVREITERFSLIVKH